MGIGQIPLAMGDGKHSQPQAAKRNDGKTDY
jgi:hypothetical protein